MGWFLYDNGPRHERNKVFYLAPLIFELISEVFAEESKISGICTESSFVKYIESNFL